MAAQDQLSGNQVEVRGVVRLGVPEVLGVRVITPLLARFLGEHPDLSIDLLVQPRFANLANREADLGVTLDAPSTGRYMVTRLASFRLYLYGSPDYLARHPPIRKQSDLATPTSSTTCRTGWPAMNSMCSMRWDSPAPHECAAPG